MTRPGSPSVSPSVLGRLRDLVSLRAFRADPYDMTVPLAERFAGQRLLLVLLYPDAVRWLEATFGRDTAIRDLGGASRNSGTPEELASLLRPAREAAGKEGHVAVAYNFGFSALKTSQVRRTGSLWAQVKSRPESVLGSDYEGGHAYSLVLHPILDTAVAFSYNLGFITSVEKGLAAAGLHCVRLQNTAGSLLAAACREAGGAPPEPVLVVSGNSVVFLDVGAPTDHEWLALRSRCDHATADRAADRRPLAYLNQVLPPRGRIRAVFDWPSEAAGWAPRLQELRPEIEFVPALSSKCPAAAALVAD